MDKEAEILPQDDDFAYEDGMLTMTDEICQLLKQILTELRKQNSNQNRGRNCNQNRGRGRGGHPGSENERRQEPVSYPSD